MKIGIGPEGVNFEVMKAQSDVDRNSGQSQRASEASQGMGDMLGQVVGGFLTGGIGGLLKGVLGIFGGGKK